MSLTFDYVTMPPKSQEISQIQSLEHTKNEQAQQEIVSQFQEGVKKNSSQTVRRKEVENEELKYKDKKEQRGNKKKQGGQREKAEGKSKEKNNILEGGNFDIKI